MRRLERTGSSDSNITAYNVSKAGVKAATEGLAHQFRVEKSATSVHLLVPGWVFTKMTRGDRTEKVRSCA